MRINLLQRHIFKEVAMLFGLVCAILLMLIVLSRIVQMRELFFGLELSIFDTIELFVYMSPIFLILVIPIACMFSVFLSLLRMSTDREFIALKAGGVGFYQMLPAPIVFSFICMGLTLFVSLYLLSWGTDNFRSTVLEIANTRAKIVLNPGVFNRDFPNLVLYAKQVDPVSGQLREVMVDDKSRENASVIILAPYGDIVTDVTRGEIVFNLKNGKIYTASEGSNSTLGFEEYVVRLDLDKLLGGFDLGSIRPSEMSWQALLDIDTEKLMAEDNANYARRIIVEIHKRWLYPFACLALTIFALPLAAMFEGLHRQYGMALALVLFFVYYAMLSFGFSIAESGAVPITAALWLPNLLFFGGGIYGIRLAQKERTPQIISIFRHRKFLKGKNKLSES